MELLLKYFPDLTPLQLSQFEAMGSLYREWNEKINVISRKDIDNLYLHHIVHSLSIAKIISFKEGSTIMDLGTGGGFPGIPLAVLFPKVRFLLIDRIGKKIKVAQEVAKALELTNVEFQHGTAEEVKTKFDFVVSRAVMPLDDLARIVRRNISSIQHNALPNGLLCLKGGELQHELAPFRNKAMCVELEEFFEEEFFVTKKIVFLPF